MNDGLIRLLSNENAFGPSKKAAQAMQSELLNLARYTDATVEVLAQKIAQQEGVSADHANFNTMRSRIKTEREKLVKVAKELN